MSSCRLILLGVLVCISLNGAAQSVLRKPVKLSRLSGTVGELLAELGSQDGVKLSYSSGIISLAQRVELSGTEQVVEDFLRSIIRHQPLTFFEKEGKVVIIFDQHSRLKKKATISGFITDRVSGERLPGASVFSMKTRQGTTSNQYGFFSLTLDCDSVLLVASHAGYLYKSSELLLQKDTLLPQSLEQHVVVNEIVVLNSDAKKDAQTRTLPGRIRVPAGMIKSLPSLMGEADVLKTLQLLPGVQAGNEGSSGLSVRGGSIDQNLVLLDGVPVYNASHAFGLFSIFNADAVHNVELLKSGFPASYGGRLSSVIDVQFKEGDKYKFHGEGGIGLIFSRLTLEGPIKKGRSSFLVSGRRTYLDLILRPILRSSEGPGFDLNTAISDLNLKVNFAIGRKNHLYFSLYTGIDKYKTAYEELFNEFSPAESVTTTHQYGFSWGNKTAMARWNHVFNSKMFGNLTFNYTRFLFDVFTGSESKNTPLNSTSQVRQKYFSSVRDLNLKYDVDLLPAPGHFIKFGINATLHYYRPGVHEHYQRDTAMRINTKIDNQSLYAGEYDLYAEDDIRISSRFKVNAGVRLSGFSAGDKFFSSLQPRFNWVYKLNNRWSLKGSAVKMNQYIHLLTNSNLGLPTDLWLPVTARVPPQVSYQVSGALTYQYDNSLEASAELYYKKLNNVIEYREGAGFSNSFTNWEDLVETGNGNTYGAEWLLQKKKGKVTGLFSYTLSWSNRRFAGINYGKTFPYKYDRRHEVKTAMVWQPSRKLEVSAEWLFASGNAISLPKGQYFDPLTNAYTEIYEGRNDFRMPAYHRMDVSVKWMKQRKKFLRTWILSVYNVYNNLNTYFIYRSVNFYTNETNFVKVTLFPVLPSVAYQFKF